MFEGVMCGNDNTSNWINTDLYVKEIHYICPNAIDLHNVTTSKDGIYIRYCGSSLYSFFSPKIKYIFVNLKTESKLKEKNT